jgi:putative transposase
VIHELRSEYPVHLLSHVLEVSPGGYYAWRGRKASARWQRDEKLLELIRQVHKESKARYGSPRIHSELHDKGERCSRKHVARLMRRAGLKAEPQRRYVVTTQSGGSAPAAPNLLQRQFEPGAVAAWVADITYINTWEGTLYLAMVMRLKSRRVIGFSMSANQTGQLALDALQMALDQAGPGSVLLHHSDRGGHYKANSYQALLERYGIEVSMSRKGDCYDNAVAESFFASLKRELVYVQSFKTRAEARQQIFEYIEVFYNRERSHSSLGYLSPVAYERMHSVP